MLKKGEGKQHMDIQKTNNLRETFFCLCLCLSSRGSLSKISLRTEVIYTITSINFSINKVKHKEHGRDNYKWGGKKAQYWTIHFSEIIISNANSDLIQFNSKKYLRHTQLLVRSVHERRLTDQNTAARTIITEHFCRCQECVSGKCFRAMTQRISSAGIKPLPGVLAVLSGDQHGTLSQRD